MSSAPHKRMMIVTLLVGAAMAAALWLLVLSPKRAESAQVSENVATQEARLNDARSQLANYQSARKQYPGMLAELKRLDKAVPARGAIPALLRQLQRRAKSSKSDLQMATLKPGSAPPAAGGGTSSTPGATAGAGGIATLPFTFTYTGEYFDLVKVLAAARRAVTVKSGDLKIDGRLVTIEGISFERAEPDAPLIKASVAATAYIAAAPADPQPSAIPAADAAQGGS
jgi:type II secretory pathway pseudopilin PulG